MSGACELREALTGLIMFAAAEEELLATRTGGLDDEDPGEPSRWGARPTLAHNAEFKRQQVVRLRSLAEGTEPPAFAEVDHSSPELYGGLVALSPGDVLSVARRTTTALLDALAAVEDADLLDPGRHAWLRGRQLWLQVVVRGFWHPTGHIAEYYLAHGTPERAVAMQSAAVSVAAYVAAPPPARGMAAYNLACALARAGSLDEASSALGEALSLNPDVRTNAEGDPDLAPLRDEGRLNRILALS